MTAEERPPTDGAAGGTVPGDAQQGREDRYAAWAKRLRDDKRTLVDSFHPEEPGEADEATHPWSRESRATAADAAPPEDGDAAPEPAFDMGLLMRSNSNESPGGTGGDSSTSDERSAPCEP
jgi:hypothetical protein